MEAAVYNNGWIKAPDATVTESESEYLTTIEFTLTSPTNFSVIFKAPTSTNKLWIACLTLRNKADEQDVNLLKNGNFSNGTTGWSFSNQANVFSNAQTLDIEAAFFDKSTVIAPPSGNMMQVYNESGWTDQLLYRRVNALSAGTYKLSVYYKHEGGWSLQVLQSSDMNGSYVKVPGATVTESEDKYFTTITFTLTATSYIRAQFNAPTNTNKMWLANLSLQHISGGNDMGRCTNYFGNPDFTVTRDGLPAGLAFWTFTNLNTAFPNAKAMDIEDGFFDKDEVTEPSSDKMLEVYNQSGWSGQQIEQQIASLPAGTYELSGHFKHEGGWSMEAEVYSDGWIKAPGATVTESQSEYLTTIEFTLTSPTNFSVIFKAPQNKSKLWISDITLRKKTDAQNVNLLKNGDFSNGTTDWSFTNKDTAFSNAQTMDIEDAFFDKATVIEPLDAKMLEVYNQSSWGGQQIEQQYKSLPAGTYELSGYFKHEGGWSMQAAVYSGGWIQAPGATVTESESEYLTTIEFTLTSPTNFSVIFKAPQNKSKLWIAGITLRKKTDAQDVNLLKNGNFSNGTTSWSFTNKNTAFPNAVTNDIPDGFFDVPEKKMAVLYNQNPSWGGQIFEAIIGMVPAGDYSFSVNFKHDGSWSVGPCYWDGSKWASIPGAQTDKSTDEYKTTVSFTLSSTQNVRIFFNAPKNTGVAYIANAKLYRTDIQSQNYITNGDFSNEFANWHYANNSFDNIYLADIPEGFFMRGPLAQQMIHVKSKGGSGTINQWLDLKTDAEYYFSYDINYADEPDKVVGAAAYVNLQYPTSSGYQYYLPYSIEVSEERYTKKYEIRVNDLAVSSNGVARIMIGLQIMPREAYIANLVLTEKGKTENLLNNPDFVYGFEGWNQGSPCIELVPYDNSKFVRNEQNTPSPLTDKYMLYTDGSSSYDDFGQHLKLPRTNGTTEIMYEFQCRYRATDGFPALRMAYHLVGATRFADDARNQGSFNVYSEYDEETGNWYGIFTIPKNAYIDKDGFAHIFLSVNTELSGAGYFTDFKLFDITNDENKTKNLLVNPDFKQGLWGWVGKGMWTVPELNFNTLRFTECKELFGLVPYDEKMFIKSDSEQYFDDGQWWIKYGETKDEQDDSENTQVLKGRMTFSDGSPIVGAPLILRSYQIHNTYTDMDGFFEFRDIPAGNYSLYMGMEDGSESLILDVNVKQGDVITVSAAYNLEIGSFDDVTNTVGKGTSSKDPSADKATNNNGKLNIIILIIIAIGAVLLVGGGITAVIFVKKKKKIIE